MSRTKSSWLAAQPLEALSVPSLLCLLLPFLACSLGLGLPVQLLADSGGPCPRRLDASAGHQPGFASRFANILPRLSDHLLPVRQRLGKRVGAVLLATEIAEGAPAGGCLARFYPKQPPEEALPPAPTPRSLLDHQSSR